jgi:hypothetical protein
MRISSKMQCESTQSTYVCLSKSDVKRDPGKACLSYGQVLCRFYLNGCRQGGTSSLVLEKRAGSVSACQ